MFDITKLALKIPNFLTYEECDGLINEFEQRKEESLFESSTNYKTNQHEQSSYKVVLLNPKTPNFNLIKEKTNIAIKTWLDYLNQPKYFFTNSLKDNLKFSHSYRIMKYETGAYIHPHSDHALGIYGSLSFNLNNNYEGGHFKFFNGNYTISLGKGDALIFPADYFWVHEVTPITKGVRYSLNSFLARFPLHVLEQADIIAGGLTQYYANRIPIEEHLGPYN